MQQNEVQIVFADSFGGLDLSNSVGNIPPDKASIFHNCIVSPDGAIVRRKGTQRLFDVTGNSGASWSTSVRTRGGSEYFVYVAGGMSIALMEDVAGAAPVLKSSISKSNIWTQPLANVRFIPLSAPHDRLLILTGNHPPVQLSFLERTASFTCTASSGGTSTFLATTSTDDSPMWRDNVAANYIVTDSAGNVIPVTQKFAGFNFSTTFAGGYVVNSSYTFTIRQVTWQWWAESLQWEGADFQQTVSRTNVTAADQSVRVPERIYSDLDPIYKNSQEIGIFAFDRSQYGFSAYTRVSVPTTENQYAFSSGARYAPGASNTPSPISPFFITFGALQAAGGVGTVVFNRVRELRFRGGDGVALQDLDVFINGDQCAIDTTAFVAPSLLFFSGLAASYTATDRVFAYKNSATPADVCQYIGFWYDFMRLPYDAVISITSVEASTQFSSGVRRVWYNALPVGGGALDGTYVRAYGIGAFSDYKKRVYHAEGAYANSRLILKNPIGYPDELLLSGVADEATPGEFYSYFQITDALDGSAFDPFTLSVTQLSREQITAIQPWQDRLFVFTNAQTYAVSSQGPLSGTNYEVSLVSSYGAFNSRCVIVGNLTVLYMNSAGVFDLLNKVNTSDYGSFQRSLPVSTLFQNNAPSSLDNLHWLSHNTSQNVLHVGLATASDTVTTSTLLRLDLTTNSWSTIGSARPFNLRGAVQLFNRTCYLARIVNSDTIAVLATEMPFYLDWAYQATVPSYPVNCRLVDEVFSTAVDKYGIAQIPFPVVPGSVPLTIAGSTIVNGNTWLSGGTPIVTLRNTLLDSESSVRLLNNNLTNQRATALVRPDQPRTLYPSTVYSGASLDPVQVTAVNGTNNAPLTGGNILHFFGTIYPSIYVSPTINLEHLGNVTRFKRLHLQFDPDIAPQCSYPNAPQARVLNTALVAYQIGAGDSFSTVREDLGADEIFADTALGLSPTVTRRAVELSLPIQGRGTDFRFWVASYGAEAFKLSSYEVEGLPQKNKKYVRR